MDWCVHVCQWLLRPQGNIQQDGQDVYFTQDLHCLFWASWQDSLHPQDVACNTAALYWRVSDSGRRKRKRVINNTELKWWILVLILSPQVRSGQPILSFSLNSLMWRHSTVHTFYTTLTLVCHALFHFTLPLDITLRQWPLKWAGPRGAEDLKWNALVFICRLHKSYSVNNWIG